MLKIVSFFTLISLPLLVEAIVGGKDVTDPHKYPWMVQVITYRDHDNTFRSCGGSIISKTVVMTAAHCVRNKGGNVAKFAKIYFGNSNLNSEEIVDIYAAFIKIHPQAFNEATRIWENDIALLLFSNELPFSNSIQPISLPNQNYTDAILLDTSKTKLIATGWGRQFQKSLKDRPIVPRGGGGARYAGVTEGVGANNWLIQRFRNAKSTNNLHFLEFYYRTPEDSIGIRRYIFPKIFANINEQKRSMIFASGKVPRSQSTCKGDSGGPLMRQDMETGDIQVIGIISGGKPYGSNDCSSINPNHFTRVSKHVPWIRENSNYLHVKYGGNPWLKSRTF